MKPEFLSQDEYSKIEEQLPEISKEIADDPTPGMLSKVIKWARHAKEEGRLQSVKYGVVHRVFATASPGQYSTILNEKNLDNLIDALNRELGFVVDKGDNWASKNIALMKSIKAEGLQDEDIYLVNTFTWTLYQKFVESGDKDSGRPDPQPDSSRPPSPTVMERSPNTILYGPPGTGKTYHTVNKALQIIDPVYYHEHQNDRGLLKRRFDGLAQQSRIGFVFRYSIATPLQVRGDETRFEIVG